MQSEEVLDYRLRLLRPHQKHCAEFKAVDLAALATVSPTALDGIEAKIYTDSIAASRTPESPDGRNIMRERIDPETGHKMREFFGGDTIFKQLSSPSMRVTRFNTPSFERGRPI
jgi:hypothetical protein